MKNMTKTANAGRAKRYSLLNLRIATANQLAFFHALSHAEA
jgi:hypothetical protein